MKRIIENSYLFIINGIILITVLIFALAGSKVVPAMVTETPRHTIIIDAGHGGIDGGAVSCTGVSESHINLEIALRLRDLCHLIGLQTLMIRDCDISIHTHGDTIAAKKVSDIKQRVQVANTTPYAIYISIHQNHYSDSRYWGSQVFYNAIPGSKDLAQSLQDQLKIALTPNNNRKIKPSSGVYLMKHMNCTGILVECGFLSNPNEENNLRNSDYQKKLCGIIAATTSQYVNT